MNLQFLVSSKQIINLIILLFTIHTRIAKFLQISEYFINELSVVPVKLAASQEATCDPFEIGTDMEKFTKALASPILDPNSCLCKSPCTPDKVEEFVRFYYMKKYICSSRFPVNI